jgi:subtilisin family serine protease
VGFGGRRHGLAATSAFAVVLAAVTAACVPVAPPPPPPPPPTCGTVADEPTPTPAAPVEYLAVVDTPTSDTSQVVTFTATSEAAVDAKVAQLERTGDVVVVEPDQPVSALVVSPDDDPYYLPLPPPQGPPAPGPNDPVGQYGLKPAASDFTTAWTAGHTGAGVTVAVIDSGVLSTHQDLVGQLAPGATDYAGGGATYPHGTHVAGIVAAADNLVGVIGGAPDADVLSIRVLGSTGSGTIANVVRGVNRAVELHADVINLSLGSGTCSGALEQAIDDAIAAGVVVVAAAGNCGAGPSSRCSSTNQPVYPAAGASPELIAVGATTSTNERASFSNSNSYVDLAAPGNAIWSTWSTADDQYSLLSGTSMATPHVAAAAALILQACPGLTPAQVKAALVSTAAPAGPGVGAGLLQAAPAVDAAC